MTWWVKVLIRWEWWGPQWHGLVTWDTEKAAMFQSVHEGGLLCYWGVTRIVGLPLQLGYLLADVIQLLDASELSWTHWTWTVLYRQSKAQEGRTAGWWSEPVLFFLKDHRMIKRHQMSCGRTSQATKTEGETGSEWWGRGAEHKFIQRVGLGQPLTCRGVSLALTKNPPQQFYRRHRQAQAPAQVLPHYGTGQHANHFVHAPRRCFACHQTGTSERCMCCYR